MRNVKTETSKAEDKNRPHCVNNVDGLGNYKKKILTRPTDLDNHLQSRAEE